MSKKVPPPLRAVVAANAECTPMIPPTITTSSQPRSTSCAGASSTSHCKVRPSNALEGLTLLLLAVACFAFSAPSAHAAISRAPNNLGLVGYWSFDDCKLTKASDSSGSGNTGTLTNFALSGATSNWMTGAQAKRGCALDFDGSNDYIDAGGSSTLRPTTAITMTAWVKPTIVNLYRRVIDNEVSGSHGYLLAVGLSNNGMVARVSGTLTPEQGTLILNQWNFISATYDGVNITNYVNGVRVGTTAKSGAISYTDATSTYIGRRGGSATDSNFSGSIDDVRIYNRALSANEVTALYNTGAAKVKAANNTGLVGYWSFDDCKLTKATDSSGYGNTGTLTNFALSGATSNWLSGSQAKRGCALSFDGTNDVVLTSSSLLTGTGDFTVSAWAYTTAPAGTDYIQGNYAVGNTGGLEFGFNATRLFLYVGSGVYSSGGSIQADTWYHVVATRQSGAVKLFINGVQNGSGTLASSITGNTSWTIGNASNYTAEAFNGSLDDVRIYNRALSANEVTALYNTGAAKVKAANNSGLVGYWSFDDCKLTKATDSSGSGNTGTLTNFALSGATSNWLSGSSAKRGCALSFDGTNDYVDNGNPAALRLTSAVTVSAWVKMRSVTNGMLAWETSSYGLSYNFLTIGGQAQRFNFAMLKLGSWNVVDSLTAPVMGTWYHVAGVYDGTNGKIYINGVLEATSTTVAAPLDTGLASYIGGYGGGQASNADIDDVRIYNRALSANEVRSLYNAY